MRATSASCWSDNTTCLLTQSSCCCCCYCLSAVCPCRPIKQNLVCRSQPRWWITACDHPSFKNRPNISGRYIGAGASLVFTQVFFFFLRGKTWWPHRQWSSSNVFYGSLGWWCFKSCISILCQSSTHFTTNGIEKVFCLFYFIFWTAGSYGFLWRAPSSCHLIVKRKCTQTLA